MGKVSASSPLRYPGGKFRARKILEAYVPADTQHVLSPFVGGGSFELFLTTSGIKVNSYDGFFLLSNFWEQLLNNPQKLAQSCESWMGKVDSPTFKEKQTSLKEHMSFSANDKNVDLLSLARDFFIVNRCSFSGATLSGGFSAEASRTRFTPSIVEKMRTWNNPNFTVQYGLYEDTLSNVGDDVDLLFLDPPYMLDGSKNTLYGIGGSMHKTFDHQRFHDVVKQTGKPFILTYNNSQQIRDMWSDYRIEEASWAYGMNKDKTSSEIIITNF